MSAIVSPPKQRTAINVGWLLLALFVYGSLALVLKLPKWAGAVGVALFTFGFLPQLDRVNPRIPVSHAQFADYFSRASVRALFPILLILGIYLGALLARLDKGTALGAALLAGAIVWWLSLPSASIPQVVGGLVRGRPEPLPLAQTKAAEIKLPQGDKGIIWGGLAIPSQWATSHFMVVGTTGSGKTLSIRLLMQDVLPLIGTGANHRALVYDPKQDVVSQLAGMNLPCDVFTLNPFDTRCVAWDIARDIKEPASALQAATTLIPPDKNTSQPFFVQAAQSLLYGVLLAMIQAGGQWRFSDVVRAMQSPAYLEAILGHYEQTQPLARRFFGNRETFNSVMATIATKMVPYEPIAAMWDKAIESALSGAPPDDPDLCRQVSLEQWIADRGGGNFVLILGNSEKARRALDAINQVIFKRVTELVLDQEENRDDKRRTWIFLDEVAEAGRLDGLTSLLAKGRSKGACVVLGFQDMDALRDVYEDKMASALTGLCNNKAILRLESPATAEWASKLFGSYEAIDVRQSESSTSGSGPGGSTSSRSISYAEHYVKREAVLESQFALLPVTSREQGLSGYYIVPAVGAFRHTYEGSWLFGERSRAFAPIVTDVPDIDRRDGPEQWLRPWTDHDFTRLQMDFLKDVPVGASAEETARLTTTRPALTGQQP